jgi:hypothetical protein
MELIADEIYRLACYWIIIQRFIFNTLYSSLTPPPPHRFHANNITYAMKIIMNLNWLLLQHIQVAAHLSCCFSFLIWGSRLEIVKILYHKRSFDMLIPRGWTFLENLILRQIKTVTLCENVFVHLYFSNLGKNVITYWYYIYWLWSTQTHY